MDDVSVLEVHFRPAQLLPTLPVYVPYQRLQLLPFLSDCLFLKRRQFQLLKLLGNLQHLH